MAKLEKSKIVSVLYTENTFEVVAEFDKPYQNFLPIEGKVQVKLDIAELIKYMVEELEYMACDDNVKNLLIRALIGRKPKVPHSDILEYIKSVEGIY